MSGRIRHRLTVWLLILAIFSAASTVGQTGSENEPVRFYGHAEDPFGAGGIGRVVREAYQDETYGPCYVRGIVEGNGNPPGNDLWLTYSMNKEDMWVSRIPVPIQDQVTGVVADDFESQPSGGRVESWNIYDPIWAPIRVVEESGNKYLQLEDHDPYDVHLSTEQE